MVSLTRHSFHGSCDCSGTEPHHEKPDASSGEEISVKLHITMSAVSIKHISVMIRSFPLEGEPHRLLLCLSLWRFSLGSVSTTTCHSRTNAISAAIRVVPANMPALANLKHQIGLPKELG